MKTKLKITILIIFIFISIFLLSSGAMADDRLCSSYVDDSDDYCKSTIPWYEWFGTIEYEGESLLTEDNEDFTFWYHDVMTIGSEDNQDLLDKTYYPIMTYDIDENHSYLFDGDGYYKNSDNTNEFFTYSDSETTQDFHFQRDILNHDGKAKVAPNNLNIEAYIPEDSELHIDIIGDNEGEIENIVIDDSELSEFGDNKLDEDDIPSSFDQISKDLDVSEKDYEFDIEVELISNDNNEYPIIGSASLSVSEEIYRIESTPHGSYNDDLIDFNRYQYETYDNLSMHDNEDTSVMPIFNKDTVSDYTTNTGFSGEGKPIRNAYVQIDNIQPSVLVDNNYKENSTDLNEGHKHDNLYIDQEEGDIHVIFDAAKNEIPSSNDNCSGACEENDLKWDYNFEELTYNIEVGFQDDNVRYKIDEKEFDEGGSALFEYSEDDLPHEIEDNDSLEIYTNSTFNMEVEQEEEIYEYEPQGTYDTLCIIGEWDDYDPFEHNLPDDAPDSVLDECEDEELEWNSNGTSTITYSYEKEDTQEVKFEAETEDSIEKANDNFGVHLLNTNNETILAFEREFDGGVEPSSSEGFEVEEITNFEETIWNRLDVSGIGKTGDYIIEDNTNTSKSIELDEEINSDDELYIDLWFNGNIGDDEISIEFNNKEISEISNINHSTADERTKITPEEGYEVDINQNEISEFELDINTESDIEDYERPIQIDYNIRTDVGETGSIQNKWNFITMRDAGWDVFYNHEDECTESDEECYDFREHGELPALEDVPDSVSTKYPTNARPLQMYLTPTLYDTEQQHTTDTIDVIDVIPETNSGYLIDDDELEKVLSYQGYQVSDDNEELYSMVSDKCSQNIDGDNLCNYSVTDDKDNIHNISTFDSPVNETEIIEFRLTDNIISNFEIYQKTPWESKELDIDTVSTSVDAELDIELIDPRDEDDEIDNYDLPDNNEYKTEEELLDSEKQAKITLVDENKEPISTYERNINNENIIVQNSDLNNGEIIGSEVDTNKDGVAYVTLFDEDDSEDFHSKVNLNTYYDWWDIDEDYRIIDDETSMVTIESGESPESIEEGSSNPFLDMLIVFITTLFIISLVLRILPNNDTKVIDLIYIIISPIPQLARWLLVIGFIILLFMF